MASAAAEPLQDVVAMGVSDPPERERGALASAPPPPRSANPAGAAGVDQEMLDMARSYRPDMNLEQFPQVWQDPFCLRDFHRDRFVPGIRRVLFAIVWFYACVYINNLCQAWLQREMTGFYEASWGYSQPNASATHEWLREHMPDVYKARYGNLNHKINREDSESMSKYYRNNTVILFDVVFLYLPRVDSSKYADVFAGGSAAFGAFRYILVPGPLSMRWTYITRVLLVWGTLWLLRAFTLVVTPLPNPYHECVPSESFPDNIWAEAYAILPLLWWKPQLTCQDVLFSGHTAMGTTFTLFSWMYTRKSPWLRETVRSSFSWTRIVFDIGAVCWLCFGWFVIAASHFHYTVDVMVGAILAFTVYNCYHRWIESIWVERSYPLKNPIEPVLRWLELNALDLRYWRAGKELDGELRAARDVEGGP